MPEITEAELLEFKQAHALLKALYADSAVGIDFRKIVKKKFPTASIPDLEAVTRTEELGTGIEKKFEELGKGLNEKIDGFLKARDKERQDNDVAAFSAKIEKISKDRGYTEEGTAKLLELMKEHGIGDPDDAVVIFESRQPKRTPKPRQYSSRMNFVMPDDKEDQSFKDLMADPEQWMVDQLHNDLAAASEEE